VDQKKAALWAAGIQDSGLRTQNHPGRIEGIGYHLFLFYSESCVLSSVFWVKIAPLTGWLEFRRQETE